MQFNYIPIQDEYVSRIRENMTDDFGFVVEESAASETGYGPCRFCLKQFRPGEQRLLFSYAPVGADNPYNEMGPVFIHKHCEPYATTKEFPVEIKKGRLPIRLVLRCYNNEKRMIHAHFVKNNHSIENDI